MHEQVVSSVYNSNNCVFLILEFNVAFKNRKDFGPLNIIYVLYIFDVDVSQNYVYITYDVDMDYYYHNSLLVSKFDRRSELSI